MYRCIYKYVYADVFTYIYIYLFIYRTSIIWFLGSSSTVALQLDSLGAVRCLFQHTASVSGKSQGDGGLCKGRSRGQHLIPIHACPEGILSLTLMVVQIMLSAIRNIVQFYKAAISDISKSVPWLLLYHQQYLTL